LYTNINQKLVNKSHGPVHYKISVSSVYNGHSTLDNLIHIFLNSADRVIDSRVSGQCSHVIEGMLYPLKMSIN